MPLPVSPVPARWRCLNALTLKLLAMALMFLDHAWAALPGTAAWMTAVGRIAFPIFAFQLAEGFFRTHDRRRYLKRLFGFALLSELPFDRVVEGGWFYPFHQNVLFTFCLAFLCMLVLEKAKAKGPLVFCLSAAGVLAVSFLVGFVTFVDYFGYGIWMVLLFYLFRDVPWGWAAQLAGLVYINWFLIGGLVWPVTLFGQTVEIPEQGLAVLALVPIWLYNGRQDPHSKAIQIACYAFYPLHLVALLGLAVLLR